jgi:hypothetical protein
MNINPAFRVMLTVPSMDLKERTNGCESSKLEPYH